MSMLRFDGQGAGLGKRLGGDANDAASYTLVCRCGHDAGPLARFLLQPSGIRASRCLICDTVTIIHDTRIVRVEDGRVIDAEIANAIQRMRDHVRECQLSECADCKKAKTALDSIERKKRNEHRHVVLG